MFENDNPVHRQALIDALTSIGLDAWELNSGGGTMHVVVSLLDTTVNPPIIAVVRPDLRSYLLAAIATWPYEASLYIATNSLNTTCDVGLMGIDGTTNAQVTSAEWQHVNPLDECVGLFKRLWDERDQWLHRLIAGELVMY